jgi:hypothetical protein
MAVLTEIYQFLFISSIIFIIYVIGDLVIKMYGRFALKTDARFKLSIGEKLIFWASLAIFFTYIIQ